jgi:leucyl-tRNA---protein transferase
VSIQEIPADLLFYVSGAQPCSYLPDQQALNLFADPHAHMTPELYSILCELGFRRSGNYVYAPRCPSCQACLPVRLPVAHYQPDRSQRRNWRANQDLTSKVVGDEFREEHFALYRRYIDARHDEGGMANPDPDQYQRFFDSTWSATRFVEFRLGGRLLAISVVDLLRDGLSAVYTFFDPVEHQRGLGVYAVQWLINETARRGLTHLYLGYLVHDCDKMAYKARYRPLEVFRQGAWQWLDNA